MLLAPYVSVIQSRAICGCLNLWQYIFTLSLTSKEVMSVQLEYLTFELGCLAVDHKKSWSKNEGYTNLRNLLAYPTEI